MINAEFESPVKISERRECANQQIKVAANISRSIVSNRWMVLFDVS